MSLTGRMDRHYRPLVAVNWLLSAKTKMEDIFCMLLCRWLLASVSLGLLLLPYIHFSIFSFFFTNGFVWTQLKAYFSNDAPTTMVEQFC